jgi:putative transposase
MAEWAKTKGMALNHIQLAKPTQNAYVERFNKTFHTEVLDCYVHAREYRVKQSSNLYF